MYEKQHESVNQATGLLLTPSVASSIATEIEDRRIYDNPYLAWTYFSTHFAIAEEKAHSMLIDKAAALKLENCHKEGSLVKSTWSKNGHRRLFAQISQRQSTVKRELMSYQPVSMRTQHGFALRRGILSSRQVRRGTRGATTKKTKKVNIAWKTRALPRIYPALELRIHGQQSTIVICIGQPNL